MDELIRLLHEGGYSCVIRKEEIRTFTQRGVADLYDLLNQHPVFLHGAQVAVIGAEVQALGARMRMKCASVGAICSMVTGVWIMAGFTECPMKISGEGI